MIGGAGGGNAPGTHTYAEEGTYPVSVTLTDDGGSTATFTGTETVGDAALTGSSAATAGGTEAAANSSILSAAAFTDLNLAAGPGDFTATINWGDSSTSSGTVSGSGGSFSVASTHTYAEEGNYPISIAVTDAGGQTATITGTATVSDPAVVPTGAFMLTSSEGVASGLQTVATFTDPGGPEAAGD